ncbi:hypothetical protein AMJ47_00155 [Parcubacteria bacterium DG_72]|nr:MAG: hypothetical protein AMJ47_00155 [Parcubacteria bacterium DG_72]
MVAKNRTKKKSSVKSILGYSAFVVAAVFIIIFLFVTNWRIYQRRIDLAKQVEELKAKVDASEKRYKDLKDNESSLGSEDHLEEVAREQLDMKKPGEEVVVVQKEEEETQPEQEEKKSWLEWIKSIFTK